MSDYEITVNIFIHLLATQPSLFSEEDRIQLIQLIDKNPDEIEALSNAISDWLAEHLKVDEALAEIEESAERVPGKKQANINIPQYKLDKKQIVNAIQRSSSSKNSEQTTLNHE